MSVKKKSVITCSSCTYKWVGTYEEGVKRLECPNCDTMTLVDVVPFKRKVRKYKR